MLPQNTAKGREVNEKEFKGVEGKVWELLGAFWNPRLILKEREQKDTEGKGGEGRGSKEKDKETAMKKGRETKGK